MHIVFLPGSHPWHVSQGSDTKIKKVVVWRLLALPLSVLAFPIRLLVDGNTWDKEKPCRMCSHRHGSIRQHNFNDTNDTVHSTNYTEQSSSGTISLKITTKIGMLSSSFTPSSCYKMMTRTTVNSKLVHKVQNDVRACARTNR
jgi:hypothetical protein